MMPVPAELVAQVRQAEADWTTGRFAQSFDRYVDLALKRLRQVGEADQLSAADLVILERLAEQATLFGRIAMADGLLSAMAELNRRHGNTRGYRYLHLHRLHLALAAGRLEVVQTILDQLQQDWLGSLDQVDVSAEGLAKWEQGLETPGATEADNRILIARLHAALGGTWAANGQYGPAVRFFDRALAMVANGAAPETHALMLSVSLKRCAALMESGQSEAAAASLAVLHPQVQPVVRAAQKVEWLELSLKLNLTHGNFGAALDHGEQIVEVCAKGGFDHALTAARLNLAQALLLVNHTQSAARLAESVLAEPSSNTAATARAERILALAAERSAAWAGGRSVVDAWRASARPQPAPPSPTATKALPELSAASNFLAFFNDRALSFLWELGQGRIGEATNRFDHMARVFADTDSVLIALRLAGFRMLLAYYQKRTDEAAALAESLAPRLRAAGLRPELWQTLRLAGWCARRAGRPEPEIQHLVAEADSVLAEMSDSLPPADRAIYLLNKWTADEEMLVGLVEEVLTLQSRRDRSIALLRPWRRRALRLGILGLLRRIEALRAKMAAELDRPTRRGMAPPALPPGDTAVLAFLVLPDRLVGFVLARGMVDIWVKPLSRLELRQRVAGLHRGIRAQCMNIPGQGDRDLGLAGDDPPPGRAGDALTDGDDLSSAIGLPAVLDRLPARIRKVIFVADDVLNGCPFAAFTWRNRPLVESMAVTVSFSTGGATTRPCRGGRLDALVVGVSGGAPPGDGLPAIPPLPNTVAETEALLPWFTAHCGAVTHLMGDEAGREALVAALGRADYVHFAGHGIFRPEAPHRSGLVLTAGGRAQLLSLADLSAMDLGRIRHATLSSCWSADSFVLPGRRIISLPETLWRAGTDSVLASLWPVDDVVAVRFMTRFHDYLGAMDRAEALRRTQCDCLAGLLGDEALTSFFWAGFVLYGATGRL